ncbi:MarR family winged helix-turn-helix transcriptional regulator [Sinomonas terrae]|uniref:MarR family transcriptional regulator n=1 Tax=Sinomonas terrae TaxID=2908838 RepID=A0ABS9U5I3_9MICC|nr:MarR family transcriptional regulator [Sinomonas terrae]MCH6471939.1 MarR family transcriptional regulator [Sinomonas terrae]
MTNPLDAQVDALQRATRDLLAVAMQSVDEVTELSLPQMRMLFALHDHGTVPSGALAHILGVSGSSVTRLADRLSTGGYVQRTQSAENRSLVLLSLTEAGNGAVEAVLRRRDEEFREALAHLEPGQREHLAAGLGALHEHLSATSLSRAVVA